MVCTVPGEVRGTIRACKIETKWLAEQSDLVDRLHKSLGMAAAAMCEFMDPPPPALPLVEMLSNIVDGVIQTYYYETINDPIGVTQDMTKWPQVVYAFTWVVVEKFYESLEWV